MVSKHMVVRRYVPAFVDHFQCSTFRHVATTVDSDGRLWAHFGDGIVFPSCYSSEAVMLEAGRADFRERMILVDDEGAAQ